MTRNEINKRKYKRCMYVYRLRGFGLTFTDIAKDLNVSYGRARDIYKHAERIIMHNKYHEKELIYNDQE